MFHFGTQGRRAALAAALLALATSAAQGAGRVFADDFEAYATGNFPFTNGWVADGGRLTPQVVTTSVDGVAPHGGTKMVSFNWNGPSNNFETTFRSMASSYSNELFLRYWVRWASDWTWSSGVSAGHFLRFYAYDGSNMSTYQDWLISNPSPGTLLSDVIIGGNRCSATYMGLPNTSWHKYEQYINRSTGVVRLWIDDGLVQDLSGCNFGSNKYDNWYVMSNWGEAKPDSTNHMYLDDFELYSDTGSGTSTGSMLNGDIQYTGGGGGVAPTVTSVSCSPTLNQAPATTTCTATATGDTPMTWAWTGQGANCTYGTPAAASTTLTCSYGGGRAPCAQATNATGTHQLCLGTNGVIWRYVKPTGIGAN